MSYILQSSMYFVDKAFRDKIQRRCQNKFHRKASLIMITLDCFFKKYFLYIYINRLNFFTHKGEDLDVCLGIMIVIDI